MHVNDDHVLGASFPTDAGLPPSMTMKVPPAAPQKDDTWVRLDEPAPTEPLIPAQPRLEDYLPPSMQKIV